MDFHGFSGYPVFREAHLQVFINTARLYHLQLAPVKGIRPNLLDNFVVSKFQIPFFYGLEKNMSSSAPPKKWGLRPMDKAICGDSINIQHLDPIKCPCIMGVYPMGFFYCYRVKILAG